MGAHGFRGGRPAAPGMGGAAGRGAGRRRQGRVLPVLAAEGVRRRRRLEPLDGGDPGASGGEGPRALQRPPERAFDRRQLPRHRHAARFRHRGAEGGVHPRRARRPAAHDLRLDGARSRIGRHPYGDPRPARDARRRRRLGDRRREDVDDGDARRHPLRSLRPHVGGRRGGEGHLGFPRPVRNAGREGRGIPLDLQHADRPSAGQLQRRLRPR